MILGDIVLSWDNVAANKGLIVSLVGMSIVFLGLLLTSLYITSLPVIFGRVLPALNRAFSPLRRLLGLPEGGHGHGHGGHPPKAKSEAKPTSSGVQSDPDLAAAIAYVIHNESEMERLSDYHKITIRRDENQQVWGVAGKMRTLATRKTISQR